MIQKIGNIISESSSIPKQTKTQLLSSLSQIESSLTNEASTVQLERESLMDELNAFRNLASLGITTGVVSHEIRDYLRNILLHTGALERELKKNHIDSSQLKQSVSYINPSVDNLRKYMALVSSFTSTIGSRKKEFRQKRNLNLHEEVRKIINGLQGIFTASEIIVENGIPHNFPKQRMYQADLQSILFNLISN